MDTIGRKVVFVQESHSRAAKDVLRRPHYQVVRPQGKMVLVVQGEVFDVAMHIRKNLPTFGQWAGEDAQRKTRNSCGYRRGFFMVLSPCPAVPNSSTKRQSNMHLSMKDVSAGMIRSWSKSGQFFGEHRVSDKDRASLYLTKAEYFS